MLPHIWSIWDSDFCGREQSRRQRSRVTEGACLAELGSNHLLKFANPHQETNKEKNPNCTNGLSRHGLRYGASGALSHCYSHKQRRPDAFL